MAGRSTCVGTWRYMAYLREIVIDCAAYLSWVEPLRRRRRKAAEPNATARRSDDEARAPDGIRGRAPPAVR